MRLVATGLAIVLLAWAPSGLADSETDTTLRVGWSATLIGEVDIIPSPENDDHVGGWFDQYDFTPNKGSAFPFELGVRDGRLDLFRGDRETAVFQSRLWSPTSNLGVSGSQIDDPFFNQRVEALTRLQGIDLDLSYRRIRTEQLRTFPNTEGPGLIFEDESGANDRFYRDRTGFEVEARLRPYEVLDDESTLPGSWLQPELSLRGGYDDRGGKKQLVFHRGPTNQWLGRAESQDRSVADVGGGLLFAPDGLLTLTADFDHQRFRTDGPILTEADLGYPPPQATRTIDFVPETDRNTVSFRFNSRLFGRAVIEGGFQYSELEQVGQYTPDQRSAGLEGNEVRYYAANAAVEVELVDDLSFNGFVKYDRREHHIDRSTPLFNDATQVYPFLDHWQRFLAGGELELRFLGVNRGGVGLRYEDVTRDLEFSPFGVRRILRENAQIDDDSRIVTLYGRTSVRPFRRFRVDAELGYRWAPETGYATELDDNLYGEIRASYVFAWTRPATLSGYLRGATGKNEDFTMVSGQGPVPDGARLPRSYEASNFVAGLTASVSPIERLSVSTSFFYSRADQDATLDLSPLQRYFQDIAFLDFTRDGKSRYENKQTSVVLGLHYQLDPRTDGSLSYSFTRAEADYSGSDATAFLDLVSDNHKIDSDTQAVSLEVGRWVVDGLRVLAGYRYQNYKNHASLPPESIASVVAPFDPSTHQHTLTLGVTLNSDFFAR